MSALTESFPLADVQSSALFPGGNAAPPAQNRASRPNCPDQGKIAHDAMDKSANTLETLIDKSFDALHGLQDELITVLQELLANPAWELKSKFLRVMTRSSAASRSPEQERQEERLSAITHGLGLVISGIAAAYLLTFVITLGGPLLLTTCSIYGLSLIVMYAASTALHAARLPEWKRRFQLCDHISIYVLIAGTYTPFLGALMQGYLGFSMLASVWTLAALGIAIKLKHADCLAETSPLPCLGLGWLVLVIIKPLTQVLPPGGLALLVAGGICYSIGMIFYCRDDKRFFHAVWHLFVMAGTAFHFTAVLFYVAC